MIACNRGGAGAPLLSTHLILVFVFRRTALLMAAINLAPALLTVRASVSEDDAEIEETR
jgi:hypothetical protein